MYCIAFCCKKPAVVQGSPNVFRFLRIFTRFKNLRTAFCHFHGFLKISYLQFRKRPLSLLQQMYLKITFYIEVNLQGFIASTSWCFKFWLQALSNHRKFWFQAWWKRLEFWFHALWKRHEFWLHALWKRHEFWLHALWKRHEFRLHALWKRHEFCFRAMKASRILISRAMKASRILISDAIKVAYWLRHWPKFKPTMAQSLGFLVALK